MTIKQRWLLPEGIDELMPPEAAQLELLHRKLIDMMQSWGYHLVVPPLVEFLDSLLTGTAKTLDLQTFKITDQMSGRMMGIRADIAPQVARIAAHKLRHENEISRLCYIGGVLNTLPQGQGCSRNPIQLGAEIYGHAGCESDVEIMQLMIAVLRTAGVEEPLAVDIGHVGIYRGLAQHAGLNLEQEQELFAVIQRKAVADMQALLDDYQLDAKVSAMLMALAELNGDESVLEQAKQKLAGAPQSVIDDLNTLKQVADLVKKRLNNVTINFDLAELRGYDYHTGLVFAAYQTGSPTAVATGGRYDDIGADFGHAQPATGFSLDLKNLAMQQPLQADTKPAIYVQWQDDVEQQQAIEQLRADGETVIYQLPDMQQDATRILVKQEDHWQVIESGTQTRG